MTLNDFWSQHIRWLGDEGNILSTKIKTRNTTLSEQFQNKIDQW
jgi:hypothetical protein